MDIALLKAPGIEFLLRWGHFLFGITWIGVLYYFNFIQGSWFNETEAQHKSAAVQKLVPRALWWFRWGAMGTFLTGVAILAMKGHGGKEIFMTSYGVMILTGALMGTFMFLNVWLIIWPAQKVVIASTDQVANGGEAIPEAAACGAKAGLASRTNTLFSIPMLFMMGAATHLPMNVTGATNLSGLAITMGIIIGALELNGIIGKMGTMKSVTGVITSGFALTVVLYAVMECFI